MPPYPWMSRSDFELKAVMTKSVNHEPRKQYDAMFSSAALKLTSRGSIKHGLHFTELFQV